MKSAILSFLSIILMAWGLILLYIFLGVKLLALGVAALLIYVAFKLLSAADRYREDE